MTLTDFKKYCLDRQIPIITDEALAYIIGYIAKNGAKTVLEIGTAYGYSAICFSLSGVHVDTFEKDLDKVEQASKWIDTFKADVTIYPYDAVTYEYLNKTYDLIFIDAAKGQYQRFFEKYSKLLNPGGSIICDNISFHNLKPEYVRKRQTRNLLKRIDNFKRFLKTHKEFETTFYDLGDGLSVSVRRMVA